jgi:hypothetical protein
MIILLTFVYFWFVPVVLLYRREGFVFYDVDYRPVLSSALQMALVALVGFYTGYYVGQRRVRPRPAWVHGTESQAGRLYAWLGIVFASVLVAAWIGMGDFPLWSLNIFDDRAAYGTWYELSESQLGYLYVARLTYMPLLLMVLAYRRTSQPGFWWTVAFAGVAGLYLLLGVRVALIILLLSAAIYLYLERGTRPKLWHFLVLGFGFYMINGFIGFARMRGQIGVPFVGIRASWEAFLEGNSLIYGMCMIASIFPKILPFQGGSILLSELLLPIPRVLWPEKPGNVLISHILDVFPVHYSPAVFGSWYADFGLAGPFIVMAGFGLASAYVYRLWAENKEAQAPRVMLALWVSLLLIVYTRVNAVGFTWMTFLIMPILVLQFLARRTSLNRFPGLR